MSVIDDVCKMLYALIDYHGPHEVFNLSSSTGASQNDIVEILKKLSGDVKVSYLPGRTVDAKKIILDNQRIRSVCEFEMISIQEGIQKYYDYIRQNRQ